MQPDDVQLLPRVDPGKKTGFKEPFPFFRRLPEDAFILFIDQFIKGPGFGFLGEPGFYRFPEY